MRRDQKPHSCDVLHKQPLVSEGITWQEQSFTVPVEQQIVVCVYVEFFRTVCGLVDISGCCSCSFELAATAAKPEGQFAAVSATTLTPHHRTACHLHSKDFHVTLCILISGGFNL